MTHVTWSNWLRESLVDAGFEEYSDRGMSDYSCSLGEWLSKGAREKLVKLSLKGLHEWSDNLCVMCIAWPAAV